MPRSGANTRCRPAIRDDASKTFDEREAAAKPALDIVENYPAHLKMAMGACDPNALPDTLDELKEVLG